MIHIFLLILKILGMILLGILALLLLVILLVLFNPFSYRAEGTSDGSVDSAQAKAVFHWLFHLISGTVSYKESRFHWHIRLAWKHFGNDIPVPSSSHQEEESSENTVPSSLHHKEDSADDVIPDTFHQEKKNRDTIVPDAPHQTEKKRISSSPYQQQTQADSESKSRIERWWEKVRTIAEKIKCTFARFCDKIRALRKKKEKLTAFLTCEPHKKCFSNVICEGKKFLFRIRPKKFLLKIHFGFEDPSVTGYVLAGLSMVYPLIGEHTDITPDFENQVLQGKLSARGKLRIIHLAVLILKLLADKNVRITYQHFKKIKL